MFTPRALRTLRTHATKQRLPAPRTVRLSTTAVIQNGKGSYVTLNDERGEYLDFTSGIGVTGLGAFAFA